MVICGWLLSGPAEFQSNMNPWYPPARWTAAIQNDFAARVDWQLKGYGEANHAPSVSVTDKSIAVGPGQTATLRGLGGR